MADRSLHGNGEACPACALRREGMPPEVSGIPHVVPCNNCGGSGRVAIPEWKIAADAARWGEEHYWPEFDRRNGLVTA